MQNQNHTILIFVNNPAIFHIQGFSICVSELSSMCDLSSGAI